MNKKVEALKMKRDQIVAKAKAMHAKAKDEDRDLTDEDIELHEGYMSEIERLDKLTSVEQDLEKIQKDTSVEGKEIIEGGAPAAERDPRFGWKNIGEFAAAVRQASMPGRSDRSVDSRLHFGAAPTTVSNEASGADGGYLIPPEFNSQVRGFLEGPDNFLGMTDDIPITGNSMSFPKDETVAWGTDGVRAYWENENSQATQTKAKLGLSTLRLKKLFALCPVTDELLADAGALSAYLPRKAGESVRWKANDSIINGDGVGKPLGVMNSGALITVSKTTGQADSTLTALNILNMYSRMLAESLGRAVWLVHHTVLPVLGTLVDTAGNHVWLGDFRAAPGGLLLGRPVLITQSAQALGTAGDIQFHDFQKYVTIRKGIETAQSMHLWFDYDTTAFRMIFRLDGLPWPSAAVSDANGSSSTSPFVILEERAGS